MIMKIKLMTNPLQQYSYYKQKQNSSFPSLAEIHSLLFLIYFEKDSSLIQLQVLIYYQIQIEEMFKLFDTVENVKMQIQKKRRNMGQDSPWGNMFGGFGGGQQNNNNGGWGNEGNNGWGQQGNNNGWGQQGGNNGWGQQGGNNGWGNQGNQTNPLQMALYANKNLWGNDCSGFNWVQQQMKRQAFQIVNPHQGGQGGQMPINLNEFGQFIEQQITFLQPSPAQKKLEELKRQGKTFYDDRFPPNNTSLTGQWGNIHEWKSIEWKRISETMKGAQIFKGKVQPGDIKQGYLGDCYFLAGLAALAERPDRIFNLFLLTEVNSVKYYQVKMLYKGKWMTIDMDQYIPFLYGKPAFSKANENQLWVMLLEKAWAKLYTSYKRIEAGYPEQALHDLTGAPIKQIYLKQAGFNKEQEWNYLLMASARQYSMVASSRPGSDTNKSETGIVQGHAYTFLTATTINFKGRQERIVQLRNPWGKGESKGRWSDNDPNWNHISPSEKQRINFHKDADDGIFYMSWDDFIHQFRALTVAQINDNASYIYKSAKDKNKKGVYFRVQVVQKGFYSFQVDKTPERSFSDSVQNQYRYPNATLQIGRKNGGQCQKLQSVSSARRTLFKGYDLEAGEYIVKVKIDFDSRFEKDFDVNLAIYGEYACDIQYASKQQAGLLTGNHNVDWNPPTKSEAGPWNTLGNSAYKPGQSGWGNNNNPQQQNDGWGGQQGGSNNNNQWGGQQGGQGGPNNGWGNNGGWGGQQPTQNNGWGQNNNTGWGNTQQNQQGNNNGWGMQQQQGMNNGWGQQPSNQNPANNVWGQMPPMNQNPGNNNGWGQPPPPNNNNNGWGW